MYFNIKEARYVKDYLIELKFENGKTGIVDLREYKDKGEVFKDFINIEYFKNFSINYGTLVWGNGEVDIAPETLYHIATGEYLSEWMEATPDEVEHHEEQTKVIG